MPHQSDMSIREWKCMPNSFFPCERSPHGGTANIHLPQAHIEGRKENRGGGLSRVSIGEIGKQEKDSGSVLNTGSITNTFAGGKAMHISILRCTGHNVFYVSHFSQPSPEQNPKQLCPQDTPYFSSGPNTHSLRPSIPGGVHQCCKALTAPSR